MLNYLIPSIHAIIRFDPLTPEISHSNWSFNEYTGTSQPKWASTPRDSLPNHPVVDHPDGLDELARMVASLGSTKRIGRPPSVGLSPLSCQVNS